MSEHKLSLIWKKKKHNWVDAKRSITPCGLHTWMCIKSAYIPSQIATPVCCQSWLESLLAFKGWTLWHCQCAETFVQRTQPYHGICKRPHKLKDKLHILSLRHPVWKPPCFHNMQCNTVKLIHWRQLKFGGFGLAIFTRLRLSGPLGLALELALDASKLAISCICFSPSRVMLWSFQRCSTSIIQQWNHVLLHFTPSAAWDLTHVPDENA